MANIWRPPALCGTGDADTAVTRTTGALVIFLKIQIQSLTRKVDIGQPWLRYNENNAKLQKCATLGDAQAQDFSVIGLQPECRVIAWRRLGLHLAMGASEKPHPLFYRAGLADARVSGCSSNG